MRVVRLGDTTGQPAFFMNNAQDFVTIARSYLGCPHRHQGRSRNGLDCVGLVIVAGKEAGALPSDFELPTYSQPPRATLFDEFLPTVAMPVNGEAQPGDLLVFGHKPGGKPRHLGIRTDVGVIWLHPALSLGRVTESRIDSQIRALLLSVWRFKAFE